MDMRLFTETLSGIDDTNIAEILPLSSPAVLIHRLPQNAVTANLVCESRRVIRSILSGEDDRLLVLTGPCSIHDTKAAREYGERLAAAQGKYVADCVFAMRAYLEKPRTDVGWTGFVYDPNLDGSYDIEKGLHEARQLFIDLLQMGVPLAVEFLDVITPQYFADCVSYGAIGARSTADQVHRQLTSGLSAPTGFKNDTEGNTLVAVQAVKAAINPHQFLSVTKEGVIARIRTRGNSAAHVILRGSSRGPNYHAADIQAVVGQLAERALPQRVVVDFSHGNSRKVHTNQPIVCTDVAQQISTGYTSIAGVMIESNLVAGRQEIGPDMVYGQSVTDACVDWDTTVEMFDILASAVRTRRKLLSA